jgi:hypothetical protein
MFILLVFILLIYIHSIILYPYKRYYKNINAEFMNMVSIDISSNLTLSYKLYHNEDRLFYEIFSTSMKYYDIIYDRDTFYIKVEVINYNFDIAEMTINYSMMAVYEVIIFILVSSMIIMCYICFTLTCTILILCKGIAKNNEYTKL